MFKYFGTQENIQPYIYLLTYYNLAGSFRGVEPILI